MQRLRVKLGGALGGIPPLFFRIDLRKILIA